MWNKYRNKYRIPSARLQTWDYNSHAAYFITICTQYRICHFGYVSNNMMQLSEIGKIVESEWLKTPSLRPDMHLVLDEFTVMPNHFHAIIIIGANKYNDFHAGYKENKFDSQSKNLGSIIRGFKSAVTMNARTIKPGFGWQPRFHDHIIRSSDEFERIAKYIRENPLKWGKDKFFRGSSSSS